MYETVMKRFSIALECVSFMKFKIFMHIFLISKQVLAFCKRNGSKVYFTLKSSSKFINYQAQLLKLFRMKCCYAPSSKTENSKANDI